MKSVEEIEQIRKQKREELDLRVNLNSATREKHNNKPRRYFLC